jgi:hypothetical protein
LPLWRGRLASRLATAYLLTETLPDFILAQDQKTMPSTLFTVGPYMDMLVDGMLMPSEELDDGTLVWENPSGMFGPESSLDWM